MNSRWTHRHSLAAAASALVPLVSGIWALGSDWQAGNWNSVEVDWTFWAGVGLVLNSVKLHLLRGDLRAVYLLGRDWRHRLNAWWTYLVCLGFELAFLMWAGVGCLSGQIPNAPIEIGAHEDIPASFISGAAFITVEAAFIGIVVFTLLARVVLGHPTGDPDVAARVHET